MFLFSFSWGICKLWIRSVQRRTQQSSFRFQLNCFPISSIQNSRQSQDSQGLPETLKIVMTLLYNEWVERQSTFYFRFSLNFCQILSILNSQQPQDSQDLPETLKILMTLLYNEWVVWVRTFLFPFLIELLSHFVHSKQPAVPRQPRPPRNIEDSDDIIVQWVGWVLRS